MFFSVLFKFSTYTHFRYDKQIQPMLHMQPIEAFLVIHRLLGNL
jgi:hypothetical protein